MHGRPPGTCKSNHKERALRTPPPPRIKATDGEGIGAGAVLLENSLVVPQKVKHRPSTAGPGNSTPGCVPKTQCRHSSAQKLARETFTAALFPGARKWKPPNGHHVHRRTTDKQNTVYPHYARRSDSTKNEELNHATRGRASNTRRAK